jgi:uncharacterized membrane protein
MTRPTRRGAVLLLTLLACIVELLPAAAPGLVAVAGLWLLFVAPMTIWRRLAGTVFHAREVCWLLATGLTVLTAIVAALLLNTVLLLLGVQAPLTRAGLAIASTCAVLALAAVDRRLTGPSAPLAFRALDVPPGLSTVLALGGACVLAAVAGTVRLNNGLGSAGSIVAVLLVAVLLVLLLVRRRLYDEGVVALGLYCAAVAILLLTSLRGWYITGHDIQREFRVFELSAALGRWDIAAYRDEYNACLSITLFPTSLNRLTGISGLYVFKLVLPLLFALTPVLVYRAAREFAPKLIAVLAAIYFLAFPTFFTDMPFLGRQGVAFLLLGCAALVLAVDEGHVAVRRAAFTVLLAGVVLSHYSTTYIVVAVLVTTKLAGHTVALIGPLRRRLQERTASGVFVTWWMVAAVVLVAFLWTGPATHTSAQLRRTVTAAVGDLVHPDHSRFASSDVAYRLFAPRRVTPEERLRSYDAEAVQLTERGRERGDYPPLDVVRTSAPTVAPPYELPLTGPGRAVAGAGVDVPVVNRAVRQVCAGLLQVLLLLGILRTVIGRRWAFRPPQDVLLLAVGSTALIGVQTVLPHLSADYGVLRSFQQGLLFFAPFIAVGSLWALSWAGRFRAPAAGALAIVFFLELIGVIPKALGGYPPQLHLDNAGQYYDIYYIHPEERAAIRWLVERTGADTRGAVQSEVQTDRYTFGRVQAILQRPSTDDIYPLLVRNDSYVFLGYTTVQEGEASALYQGDVITYRYPFGFLDATKDKIYSSTGASVYR